MDGDLELLERAAGAAGIELHPKPFFVDGLTMKHGGGILRWNPLLSDGDAMRLAVKCGLIVDTQAQVRPRFDTDEPATMVVLPRPSEKSVGEWHSESDPYAATRRAIVRAAAAMAPAKESEHG